MQRFFFFWGGVQGIADFYKCFLHATKRSGKRKFLCCHAAEGALAIFESVEFKLEYGKRHAPWINNFDVTFVQCSKPKGITNVIQHFKI